MNEFDESRFDGSQFDESLGDPRLTAYALGELEGAERESFEAALAADPLLRAELEEVRRTALLLGAAFPPAAGPSLAPLQRARVLSAAAGPVAAPVRRTHRRLVHAAGGVAAAATVVVCASLVGGRGEGWEAMVADAGSRADGARTESPEPEDRPEVGELAAVTDLHDVELGLERTWLETTGHMRLLSAAAVAPAQEPPRLLRLELPYPTSWDTGLVVQGPVPELPGPSLFSLPIRVHVDPDGETDANGGSDPARYFASTSGRLEDESPRSGQVMYDLGRQAITHGIPALYAGPGDLVDPGDEPQAVYIQTPDVSFRYGITFTPDVVPTGPGSESYPLVQENLPRSPESQPLSTFSIDVDTASYANVRRFLQDGQRPPVDAVRIEELVNAFAYDYPAPTDERPFAVDTEVGDCPWAPGHRLLRIGLRGRPSQFAGRAPLNVVFLIDVSGSMKDADKLPLLKDALRLLVDQLTEDDSIAIVTYSDEARVALEATHGGAHERILAAIDALDASGSTNGEGGLRLAYEIAARNLRAEGVDRVLLASDGDFNVGLSEEGELEAFIAEQAAGGVGLTVLGFGQGNLKDSKLAALSQRGNGNQFYVDGLREARKVLVEDLGANFETIAADVKVQVDFNPACVASYRLIGYETRALAARDFTDDARDAGEIGPDHRVTALYELVPAGQTEPGVQPSKYASAPQADERPWSDELCTVRLRYKAPGASESTAFEVPVASTARPFDALSTDTRFAAAVAAFGLALRDSPHRGTATLADVRRWALDALGDDADGRRTELCDLARRAQELGVR